MEAPKEFIIDKVYLDILRAVRPLLRLEDDKVYYQALSDHIAHQYTLLSRRRDFDGETETSIKVNLCAMHLIQTALGEREC